MKYIDNPPKSVWNELVRRNNLPAAELSATIKKVFEKVEKKGDEALLDLTFKFDGIRLSSVKLPDASVKKLSKKAPAEAVKAINEAYRNIYKFHQQTKKSPAPVVKISDGVECWSETRPIEKVGLYVPGGSAPLVSTVLMLGIPAQIAGSKEIVLCTPPDKNGKVNPAICYAAQKCGIKQIFTLGGAQAIASMAQGTKTVPKVDKIFGPGNQYVTAAKQSVINYGVAIDMPAGPSEVMVIADETAKANFVAADLLSQAEHGPDSQAVLLTNNKKLAASVKDELTDQLKVLSRKDIAKEALKKSLIIVLDKKDIADFANLYAPEHLIINSRRPTEIAKKINNAGSVFLGQYSPESAGDYASGTNHTLPTGGWARSYSGLSVADFQRTQTFQRLTKKGLKNLSGTVTALAVLEGLDAHARAVTIRVENKV